MTGERKLSYDIIRIVAAAMVVMVHVSAYVVTYFEPDPAGWTFIVGNLFNGLARAGTPMFLMLSGALWLDEKREIRPADFCRGKLLPLCGLLLFWLLFYAAWRHVLIPLVQHEEISVRGAVDYILWLKGRSPHLWYMFMLIGAYLAVPVLRLFVKRENKKIIFGMILFSAAVQFAVRTGGLFTLGMEHTLKDFVDKFHIEYATGYLPYLLIGWYLTAFPPEKKTRLLMEAAGLCALAAIILSVWFGVKTVPSIRDHVSEMDTLPAMLYGTGLFAFICAAVRDRPTRSRTVRRLSAHTFGIYITHVFVLELLLGLVIPYSVFHEQHPLAYILVLFVLAFSLSLLITVGLSVIPGVKKLVRG